LVTSDGTRRVLSRARLLERLPPSSDAVLVRLTQSRLVSVRRARDDDRSEAELELAHESLVRAWKTMARWIDEGREEVVLVTQLGQAAELWERRGRRDDEVWRGRALSEVESALARLGTRLPEQVVTFLAASRRLERRAHRRGRLLVGGSVAVLAAIALI